MATSIVGKDIDRSFLQRFTEDARSEIILDALSKTEFVESNRKNVREPGSTEPIYGMCLGLTGNWQGNGAIINKNTWVFRELTRLLCAFARKEIPDFEFTSIQVNKNYAAALHTDAHDAGDSYIIAFGNYVGGELWVANRHPLGHTVDIHKRWYKFSGESPHAVFPFKGCRYSIVYFTRRVGGDIGADPQSPMKTRLLELGFPLPTQIPVTSSCSSISLDAARLHWKECFRVAQQRGGAGRVLLRLRMPDEQLQWVALKRTVPLGELAAAVKNRHEDLHKAASVSVEMKVNSFPILPNDTIKGLQLKHAQTLDITLVDACPSTPKRKKREPVCPPTPKRKKREPVCPTTPKRKKCEPEAMDTLTPIKRRRQQRLKPNETQVNAPEELTQNAEEVTVEETEKFLAKLERRERRQAKRAAKEAEIEAIVAEYELEEASLLAEQAEIQAIVAADEAHDFVEDSLRADESELEAAVLAQEADRSIEDDPMSKVDNDDVETTLMQTLHEMTSSAEVALDDEILQACGEDDDEEEEEEEGDIDEEGIDKADDFVLNDDAVDSDLEAEIIGSL